METVQCVVERVTYQNANGWSVLRCSMDGCKDLITIVGNLASAAVGSTLSVEGEWKVDPNYGKQLSVMKWEERLPATINGIEKYLGGGFIKGIGAKKAKKIVDFFGLDTIRIIEQDFERLAEIPGINKKTAKTIAEGWEKQKGIKNVMMFLQQYNVSPSLASRIYKYYEGRTISVIKQNPYCLTEMWGVGFKTADTLALNMGFDKENPFRLKSGIVFTLEQLGTDGHVYAERQQLIDKAAELLQVPQKVAEEAIDNGIEEKTLIKSGNGIYIPKCYYAECIVSDYLKTIAGAEIPSDKLSVNIPALEAKLGIQFDEVQADAVRTAMHSKVMVLTGGPGTGKTTTTQGIIEALEENGLQVLLAAPTGRAAKRMSEATNREAKTIHRLLEYQPKGGEDTDNGFQKNEESPLEGDALIVDESSMIDIHLMAALVKAIPAHMRLILVGDVNQLPSVGAGNVLKDIIESGVFNVVRLTKIFRQAQESQIVMNAHRINAGQLPCVSNQKGTDFWFINTEKPDIEDDAERSRVETEYGVEQIVSLVSKRLPQYCKLNPSEIQVLAPMRKGQIGTDNLNMLLQNALNANNKGLQQGGREFRVNDKVMQIRNNYDNDVYNGDIGTVVDVRFIDDEANEIKRGITVDFDGNRVLYNFDDLIELVHAYACTIHKSQGSEYPVVVMPVSMVHYIMLQRNLIYTGVTRAKKMIVLVGTRKALRQAVNTVTVTKRNTYLKERLQGRI